MKRLFLLTLGLVAVGAFVAWYQAMFIDPDFTEKAIGGE